MAKKSSDSTIKFLIYILSFLIFVLLVLLLFIIPSIKAYKTAKADRYRYESQSQSLIAKKASMEEILSRQKRENSEIVKSFTTDFDEKSFLDFSNKYFENVQLKDMNESNSSSQFQMYTFSAKSLSKTPVDLYEFIDELDNYPSIIKINFPIVITSDGKSIDLQFEMSIYKQNN